MTTRRTQVVTTKAQRKVAMEWMIEQVHECGSSNRICLCNYFKAKNTSPPDSAVSYAVRIARWSALLLVMARGWLKQTKCKLQSEWVLLIQWNRNGYMNQHLGINCEQVVKCRTTRKRMRGRKRTDSYCNSGQLKQRGEANSTLLKLKQNGIAIQHGSGEPCSYTR